MPVVGSPTLDQLQVFLAVVEARSFAAAARTLGRATSAITYQVDNLEAQLGLALFDRIGTRRPVLTAAGTAMLAEAQAVMRGIGALKARVTGLLEGLEAQLSLAVDVMLPAERLVDVAQAFQAAFPTVPLRLHVEALGSVQQMVQDSTAMLGIAGPLLGKAEGLTRIAAGSVEMIPVAAPTHKLARRSQLASGEARAHVQLVLTDRSDLSSGRDFSVLGERTWRLGDLSAKHALLLAGVGWGGMPRPMVEADLMSGRLVQLPLPEWPPIPYPFHILHRADTAPGPAARWLINRLLTQTENEDGNQPRHSVH